MSFFEIPNTKPEHSGRWAVAGLIMACVPGVLTFGLVFGWGILTPENRPGIGIELLAVPVAFFIGWGRHLETIEASKSLSAQKFWDALAHVCTVSIVGAFVWCLFTWMLRIKLEDEASSAVGSGLFLLIGGSLAIWILKDLCLGLFGPNNSSKDSAFVRRGAKLVHLDTPIFPLPGFSMIHRALFGGRWVEPATQAVIVMGQSRSGKTLTLLMYLRSCLMVPRGTLQHRLLAFDPKGDFYSRLRGWGIPDGSIKVLNPRSLLGIAWDIARDSLGAESEIASVLAGHNRSRNSSSHPFFDSAFVLLLTCIICYLNMVAPGRWTLRDLVLCLEAPVNIMSHILERAPGGGAVLDKIVRLPIADETSAGVIATLSAELGYLRKVAALWEHCKERFSLQDFIKSTTPQVLLIRADVTQESTFMPLVRAIYKRFTNLLCEGEETTTNLTYVLIDEMSNLGKLDGTRQLMTRAPSKGARLLLGCHSKAGLAEIYGANATDEFLGQGSLLALLRNDEPALQEHASRVLGSFEGSVPEYSYSRGRSGGQSSSSTSVSNPLREHRVVLPQEFGLLKRVSRENGLEGFYKQPGEAPWKTKLSGDFIDWAVGESLPDSGPTERPRSDSQLKPWDRSDYERLKLPPPEGLPPEPDSNPDSSPPSGGGLRSIHD